MTLTIRQLVGLVLVVSIVTSMTLFVRFWGGDAALRRAAGASGRGDAGAAAGGRRASSTLGSPLRAELLRPGGAVRAGLPAAAAGAAHPRPGTAAAQPLLQQSERVPIACAAAYTRVSTADQNATTPSSAPTWAPSTRGGRAAAGAGRMRTPGGRPTPTTSSGESGLARLLADAEAGAVDRGAGHQARSVRLRNAKLARQALDRLRRRLAGLVSVYESLTLEPTTTATGLFQFALFTALAEMDSHARSERVARPRRQARRRQAPRRSTGGGARVDGRFSIHPERPSCSPTSWRRVAEAMTG